MKFNYLFIILFILPNSSLIGQTDSVIRYYKGDKILNERGKEGDYSFERTIVNDELTFERKTFKTYNENGYIITPVIENETVRTFKERNNIEVSLWVEVKREYGKYFKTWISILNKSDGPVDFMADNYGTISTIVEGTKAGQNILPIGYEKYQEIVSGKQLGNSLLTGMIVSIYSSAFAYTTASGVIRYKSSFGSGYYSYSSTFYSPALAQMEYDRVMGDLNQYLDYDKSVKVLTNDYLRNHTIDPKSAYEGYVVLPFDKKVSNINYRIIVGETPFNFNVEIPKQ